ncbi:glycosyltransferase family 22 protein [Jaapia argillacea MUCL 33604]|uniref:Mannosyltransferase n=1 Tax=Jaapia argillacea MUCL 33604 TaxID=933084 RepID=A0A067PJI4_9AGAM|nr:glycosyltransferase family 22 protein [Jaapia argillacea MUCL 33604]
MQLSLKQWRQIYRSLLVLRVFLAFWGTGYIHPDEYFQNAEVTAGPIFGWHTLRTWEWDPKFPCRSIIPPFLTTGLPFAIVNHFIPLDNPVHVFLIQRASFFFSSLLLDYALTNLLSPPVPLHRTKSLVLLASSHTLLTFQLRPFSNSIEAVLLALVLVVFKKVMECGQLNRRVDTKEDGDSEENKEGGWNLCVLAMLFVLGIWTRITFVAFTLPTILQLFRWSLLSPSSPHKTRTLKSWLHLISLPTFYAILTTLLLIASDTLYFRSSLSIKDVVVTPLNFLAYNLSSDNLSAHGIHPRYLHILVNLPLIIGPGLVMFGCRASWVWLRVFLREMKVGGGGGAWSFVNQTLVFTIISSVTILSIQPHQEPRFLIPLLVPFVALVGNSRFFARVGKVFWTTWIVSNILLTILFGIFHQGGVIPSVFHLRTLLDERSIGSKDVRIVYWKTYMPPGHLLGVSQLDGDSGKVTITDLAGASPSTLLTTLSPLTLTANTDIYLIAPIYAMPHIPCLVLQHGIFPHLNLDHLDEVWEVGLRDGLTLGVFGWEGTCEEGVGG